MDLSDKTEGLLRELFEKYRLSGQNTEDYLEGLLVSNYEPYWKYLHLDTLLSLQNPKTDFNDEFIFIAYHQITELYFRLILHEIEVCEKSMFSPQVFKETLVRINRYLGHLITSFDIMVDGMRPEEFLKFRMALLPASGFQSSQFRRIELSLTDVLNLVETEIRSKVANAGVLEQYAEIYWKKGSIDKESGEKTLTLRQFEQRYDVEFSALAADRADKNLYFGYRKLRSEGKLPEGTEDLMRELDLNLNVHWRLSHYRSAVRYLHRPDGDVGATGGTNWQKFLPPRFQKIISFPELWSEEEKENWGKHWVQHHVKA